MRNHRFHLALAALLMLTCGQIDAATVIPFEFRDGLSWVKITTPSTSRPLEFLLDSGAGVSVLDTATAKELGVRLGPAEQVLGVGGNASARAIERFKGMVGRVPVPERLLAIDLSAVSAACHRKIDGLLGADFFRERIVQLDFGNETLRLLTRGEVDTSGCESLPLARRHDALCTQVAVAGRPSRWMRVDTGCDSALRWVDSSRANLSTRKASIGVAVGPAQYVVTDVRVGNLRFHRVLTAVHRRPIFPGEAGLLGNGLLSQFVVTFDVPGKRLLLRSR